MSARPTRGRFVLASLAVVALLVLACGQAPAPTASPGPTEAPASPQPVKGAEVLVPTQVPTRPAVETPKPAASSAVKLDLPVPREETLVMATGPTEAITIPDSFNPFTPRGVQPGVNWNAALNEPLLYHNVEGTTPDEEWIGGLGEKFEYNRDFTSYTVKLRDGIKWNDGAPFTSADVKYTVDLILGNPALGMRGPVNGVKSIDAPDAKTIVFNLSDPNPRYHYRLASQVGGLIVVAKHKWEGQDPTSYKNNPPVATGPYKLKQVLVEQKQFVFERDDNYWGKAAFGLPKPKYVAIVSPPPADLMIEGFKAGLYDYASAPTYDAAKKASDDTSGFVFTTPFLDLCPRALRFNHAIEPTNKLPVRQAIAQMVDRKTAAATLWKPPSRITSRPWYGGSAMLRFADPALVAKYDAIYTGDQQKALQLFQEAGYKQQGGKLVDAAGKQMRLDIYTNQPPTTAENPIAVKLTEDLKKLGVDAVFKFETGASYNERFQKGDWHVTSQWQCGADPGDPALMYQNFTSDRILAPVGQLNQGTNYTYYKNPKFDELVGQLIAVAPDDPKAKPLYDQIYQLWMDDMVSFPIMETVYTQMGQERYWKNFPHPTRFHTHPANWHMTMMNIVKRLEPGPMGKAS